MTRQLSNRKTLQGGVRILGPLLEAEASLDDEFPAHEYLGAIALGVDRQLYYSDGLEWRVPTDTVLIARPSALIPTNDLERTQLRATEFVSPTGLTQIGAVFQVSSTSDGFLSPLFERVILPSNTSFYQVIYPEDGIGPEQTFWWRMRYQATDGAQSEWSIPFEQTFPKLISDPEPRTREGATSGVVEVTPFESAFGFNYVETQIEFYALNNPTILIETLSVQTGSQAAIPSTLDEGEGYLWRARYGGRVEAIGPVSYTEWTAQRSVFNGAASMVLTYDASLAVNRTIELGLNEFNRAAALNAQVDWGDGTMEVISNSGVHSHTFPDNGQDIFAVTISGTVRQFGARRNQPGLIGVNAIGFKMGLTSLQGMLAFTTRNLATLTSAIPPQITDISYLFEGGDISPNVEVAIGQMDTREITNMRGVFKNCGFNGDLSGWEVSNAETLSELFRYNEGFQGARFNNSSLNGWTPSSCTNFSYMFAAGASDDQSPFNQDISNWDMSACVNMEGMFQYNSEFDQDLSGWQVGNVTNFSKMFLGASSFSADLSDWDVSKGVNFAQMFEGATAGRYGLSNWSMGNARTLRNMFAYSGANIDVTNWNTINVTDLSGAFRDVAGVSGEGGLVTRNVTDMSDCFTNTPGIRNVSNWDTSNVRDMSNMFRNNSGVDAGIGQWNFSKVTSMNGFLFLVETAGNLDLSGADFSSCTSWHDAFRSSGYRAGGFGWKLSPIVEEMRLTWFDLTVDAYSETLISFAKHVQDNGYPLNVSLYNGFFALIVEYDAQIRDPGGPFPTAVDARNYLLGQGWTITGDVLI